MRQHLFVLFQMLSVSHGNLDGLKFQFIPNIQKCFDDISLLRRERAGQGADTLFQNSTLFTQSRR